MIRFLCGCESHGPITRENLPTFEMLTVDEEGFIVCKLHYMRRKGWRSLPKAGVYSDFSKASWTPLEVEAFVLFEEVPVRYRVHVISQVGEYAGGPGLEGEPALYEAEKLGLEIQRRMDSDQHRELACLRADAILHQDENFVGPSRSGRRLLARGRELAAEANREIQS